MSSLNDRNSTEEQNDNAAEESPVKKKRGRPKSQPEEVEKSTSEDGSDAAPVVKRKRGRPKGSKNKNPKPKPVITGPPRPRGRPRKYPPKDESAPKRGRGRPRKNESQSGNLPTMVQPEKDVENPITHDPVPPDEMFADELES